MKKIILIPVAAMLALIISSCKETKIQNVTMKNAADSLSYAIGINIGQSFKEQKITDVNTDMMADVIKAIITDDTIGLKLNDSTALVFLNNYMRKKGDAELAEKKAEGEKWLAEIAKQPGIQTTPSGLMYKVVNSGSGASPKDGDQVSVNYIGRFSNGEEFDSSIKNGQPSTFNINEVIPGWTEGLKMMKEGDKWNLYIKSELAWGPAGYQGFIPPNAAVQFEVELLKVIPAGTEPDEK
ncbi:MAG: FKBP-type peptidyl-prolyl cis-trans isomerase [Chitinophagales bacterium]